MAEKYNTIQQHEPIRVPTGWGSQEKRFIAQLEELFDDLYSRFNRLKMTDLSKPLQEIIIESSEGVSGLTTRVSQAEIDIDAAEAAIALKASQETVDGLNSRLSQAEIDIDGAEAAIALKASQSSVDGLSSRVAQAEIDIDGAEAAIALKASQTSVDSLGARVTQAELDIDGAEAAIALKVSTSDYNGTTIVSLINLTPGTALIEAEHINLVGKVTATSLASGAVTTDKLDAGAVTTPKLASSAVTADKIAANTITVSKLASDVGSSLDISSNESLSLYVANNANKTYTQWADPALETDNTVHDGDIWIKSEGMRTWGELSALTWAEAASYKWGDFTAAKQYVRKNGAWALTDDPGDKYVIRSGIDILPQGIEIGGAKYIRMLSGADFQIKAGGTFTVDSGNFSIDANGNVTMTGTVSAADGHIADWAILPGRLKSGDGTGYVALDSDPSGTYAIWAGAESADSAPFRVARDGTVYAAKIVTETEQGASTTYDLTQFPLWKLWYHVIKSYDTDSITLSNGTVINFNHATPVILTGSWSGTTAIGFTYTVTDGGSLSNSTTVSLSRQYDDNTTFDSTHKKWIRVTANNKTPDARLFDFTIDASGEYNSGVTDGQAAGYASGWAMAYGMVSLPETGSDTTFGMSVPGQTANSQQAVTFTLSKDATPASTGYAYVYQGNTKAGQIAIGDWYTAGVTAGWNAARAKVAAPAAGTGTSFTVKVPSATQGNQETWTFSLSKGTPGSSGYASVSRSGTVVGRIAIGDWYDAGVTYGWNAVYISSCNLTRAVLADTVTVVLSNGTTQQYIFQH